MRNRILDTSSLIVSQFIDFLPDPTFAVDTYGRVILWNTAMEKISGVRAEDMLGKGDHECALPFYGTRRPMLVDMVFSDCTETEKEYTSLTRDGDAVYAEGYAFPSRRYLWGKASPIRDESGRIIGAVESVRDMTAFRQAETELRQSESRYRDIFMNVSDLIYVHDLQGRFMETNLATKKESGYTERDLEHLSIRDILPERYRHRFEDYMTSVLSKGYDEGTMIIVTKTGDEIVLEYRNSLIFDAGGHPAGVRGSARDITRRLRMEQELRRKHEELHAACRELKAYGEVLRHNYEELARSQQALRASEERFRNMASHFPGAAFQFFAGPDGRMGFHYMSEGLEELLGIRHDSDGLYEKLVSCIAPEDRGAFVRSIQAAIAAAARWDVEARFIRPDGEERYVRGISQPVRHGDQLVFNGTVIDITARKRAQRRLEKSEEKFSKAFHASPSAISLSTLEDGRFIEVNESFLEMSGYNNDEVIGRTAVDLGLWTDPGDRELLVDMLREGEPVRGLELHVCVKSGSVRICRMSADIISIDTKPCLLLIVDDITDQRRMEDERAMYEARLMRTQKLEAIGTLAGGIAHDFNNILSAVIGYAELALEDSRMGLPVENELKEVLIASERARDLVRQILTFSRQSEVERRPLRVPLIVKEALKLLRSSIPSTISIVERVDQAVGPILADPTQVHQVVMNLCTNAYQAMMPRGGDMTVSVDTVHLDRHFTSLHPPLQEGGHVRISVRDTGCGMDGETVTRIFDPFFTTKEKTKGTGLGLATVHGIVTSLGGAVTVTSALDRGSTFDVYLPLFTGETRDPAPTPEDAPWGRGESVLLVDDEETILSFAGTMLDQLGYRVTTVSSGIEALDLFRSSPSCFDLVITDQTMPGMTGADLASEILGTSPAQPVILMTGYSETLSADDALSLGIRRYIEKPFNRNVLAREIRRCLDEDRGRGGPD